MSGSRYRDQQILLIFIGTYGQTQFYVQRTEECLLSANELFPSRMHFMHFV